MIEDFKNKTIMIVDDEEDILEVMADMIQSQIDLSINTYKSPTVALEKLKEEPLPRAFA